MMMRDLIFSNEWVYIVFKILALIGCFALLGFIASISAEYMSLKKFKREALRRGK